MPVSTPRPAPLPRRTRKLIGAFAMLAFVIFYALALMSLAQGTIQEFIQTRARPVLPRRRHQLDPAPDAAHPLDGAARSGMTAGGGKLLPRNTNGSAVRGTLFVI